MSFESSPLDRHVGPARQPGLRCRWCRRTSPMRRRRATSARPSTRSRRPPVRSAPASASPASIANSTCICSSRCAPRQSGASYADLRSSILSSLQSIYGTPGGTGTLETAFNNLVTAVQGLSTSSGQPVGADRRAQCRAVADAAAQQHDGRRPDRCAPARNPGSIRRSTPPTTRCSRSSIINNQLQQRQHHRRRGRGRCWTSATSTSISCRN